MKQCTLCPMHIKPDFKDGCCPSYCWLKSIHSPLPANLKKQAT